MNPLSAPGAGTQFPLSALDLIPQEAVVIDDGFTIRWLNKAKQLAHPDLKPGLKCYWAFENTEPCPFCLADQAREIGHYVKNPVCILTGPHRNVPRHVNITLAPLDGRTDGSGLGDAGEPLFLELVDNVEAVYQSHSELERLNHEYENVIYALSHDLRSPLISIEGFLNKIEKHMGTPVEPVAHSLDRIHANVKIMNQLVNVLLDTSRIITGILDLHETDMGKLAREAAEQFAAQAAAQGARIEVTGDFEIETCDRVRVQQVYANLIGNALKHCRQTEGLVIELGADKRVYRVRDNGPGIPRDFQDVVFEPFTQGSKKLKESFGMGMNIVFRIMQKHGGEIWLETKESKGTTIFFAFKTPCNGQA